MNPMSRRLLYPSIVSVLLASTSMAQAHTRIAVVADHYTKESALQIAQSFAKVLENLRAGDEFIGLSPSGKELWKASLPDEDIYDSHALHRKKILAPAWAQLMGFFRDSITDEKHNTQVNYPLVIDNLRYRVDDGADVAFFGDPLWDGGGGNYAAFALNTAYPTDGHFSMSKATTPFGKGSGQPLKGVRIHFCAVDAGNYLSGNHEEGIKRTYGLMGRNAGGQLVTFSNDIAECSNRFSSGENSNAPSFSVNSSDHRFGMISGATDIRVTPVVSANLDSIAGQTLMGSTLKLVLIDNDENDGDVIELKTAGFSFDVKLSTSGQAVSIPLVQGEEIRLKAIKDGSGGGVTVTITSIDGQEILNADLSEGEERVLEIPKTVSSLQKGRTK